MNVARLRELAETYGADLDRWPADERSAACALLATTPAAATVLERARRLDDLLAGLPPTAAPERLAPEIVRAVGLQQAAARRRTVWTSVLAGAAAVAAGVAAGWAAAPATPGWNAPRHGPPGDGAVEQTSFGRLIAEDARAYDKRST